MKFNDLQLEKLSDILINLGIVFVATNIIPLLSDNNVFNINELIKSGMVSFGLWFIAISILDK